MLNRNRRTGEMGEESWREMKVIGETKTERRESMIKRGNRR